MSKSIKMSISIANDIWNILVDCHPFDDCAPLFLVLEKSDSSGAVNQTIICIGKHILFEIGAHHGKTHNFIIVIHITI